MKLAALIFDLDGTLVDSLGDIGAAMNRALESFGFPSHPIAAYREFVGEGIEALAARAMPAGQEALHGELVAACKRDYAVHMFVTTRAFPGVGEVVNRLSVPLGVLSNKLDAPTRAICAQLFPGRFRSVRGALPGVAKKPDPAAALHVAAELGVPPQQIGFVGDTAIDVATARAAGMVAIGVTWGFRPAEIATADRVISRADELYELC